MISAPNIPLLVHVLCHLLVLVNNELPRILCLKSRSPLHNFGYTIIDLVDVNVISLGVSLVFDRVFDFCAIFSCDQAALWMVQSVRLSVHPSVRPSVCPSVCHTFLTMFPSSYHHEIFRSYYQWQKWRPCKRSRSEVKGQGHRGHNPT